MRMWQSVSDKLRKYVDELVQISRQNYYGPISYQEWDYWLQYDNKVNWNNMDNVSMAPWVGSYNRQFLNDQSYLNAFRDIKKKYNKPLFIVEVGSFTVTEAEEIGGPDSEISRRQLHHDPKKQSEVIDRYLRLLYQAGVDAIFICMWDEPAYHPWGWGDANKLSKGIWDYAEKEPKQSFWTVYKYYKE